MAEVGLKLHLTKTQAVLSDKGRNRKNPSGRYSLDHDKARLVRAAGSAQPMRNESGSSTRFTGCSTIRSSTCPSYAPGSSPFSYGIGSDAVSFSACQNGESSSPSGPIPGPERDIDPYARAMQKTSV